MPLRGVRHRRAADLHTFPLHNVDIIFRASVVTVQTQGSPEVGPQLAVTSDKGANYFSVAKAEGRVERW